MYICIYQIHIQVCDTMCIVLVFVVLHSQLCICPFQMHYVIHKWASCLSMLSQPVCSCSFNDNSSVTSLSFTGRYRWVYRLNCSFTSTQQVPWHKEHSWLWQKEKVEWSEQKSNCIKTKSKCLNRYHYDYVYSSYATSTQIPRLSHTTFSHHWCVSHKASKLLQLSWALL